MKPITDEVISLKLSSEDFDGYFVTNVLAKSSRLKKRLQAVTFLDSKRTEVVFQVVHGFGTVKERTSGYPTLAEAVQIYNMAEG